MHRTRLLIILCVCLLTWTAGFAAPQNRNEIDPAYRWRLADIYPGWEPWSEDLQALQSGIEDFGKFQGTLAGGGSALAAALQARTQLALLQERLYTFAAMSLDLDNRENSIYSRLQEIQNLMTDFSRATAWFNPELLAIPFETMEAWLNSEPALEEYSFGIRNLYRLQTHVLDADAEQLLAYFIPVQRVPATAYNQLSTSDIQFKTVVLSNGDSVQVTEGEYRRITATNRNQSDRRQAMQARNSVYNATINTYAALYDGICKRDWATAQARNYGSSMEASLERNDIPPPVYTNLLETVQAGTAPLQRYHELRREALNLEEYHFYDSSIPILDVEVDYPYPDVRADVLQSMKPLGKSYHVKLKEAFSPGWVDVYETPGKTTGAYSWGVYGVHPYMLLNYSNTLDDVFTVAHEMGHTVHTMFSWEEQPYVTSEYTLFVAEVASTMGEAQLLDYLLRNTRDPEQRLVLLSHAIDNIAGTFYTQALFADWEYQAHRLVELGQPVTAEKLNALYRDLVVAYYGSSIAHDDLYDMTWARIPHFFGSPFYVYQYATSFAASAALHDQIRNGNRSQRRAATANYIRLLQSGGSDYPVNELRDAGVDMTSADPILAVIQRMGDLVEQFEEECRTLGLIGNE